MPLRDGKEYLKKILPKETQPFRQILLPEKVEKKQVYEVKIDFDESSMHWRKNKYHLGEGMFMYKRYSERITH
jgi:hypothetical protein